MFRHDLKAFDFGLEDGSFIMQLSERGHKSLGTDELTEDQNKYLAGWLRGLYDPEGISDELLSSCRPQDFYLLVPTIFSQTIFACSADVLPLDTVKAGLECKYLLTLCCSSRVTNEDSLTRDISPTFSCWRGYVDHFTCS